MPHAATDVRTRRYSLWRVLSYTLERGLFEFFATIVVNLKNLKATESHSCLLYLLAHHSTINTKYIHVFIG